MAEKNLTGRQILLVLLIFPLGTFAVMAWGGDISDETRELGERLFWISVPIYLAIVVWEVRSHLREDIEPDILATMVHPNQIYDVGHAHFVLLASQRGAHLIVTCTIQNLYDTDTEFEIVFKARSRSDALAFPIPNLDTVIPPAAVVEYTVAVPLNPSFGNSEIRQVISGDSRAMRPRRRLRFARRNAVTKPVPLVLTILGAVTGHIAYGGGTFLSVYISPFPPEGPAAPPSWSSRSLWSPTRRTALLRY